MAALANDHCIVFEGRKVGWPKHLLAQTSQQGRTQGPNPFLIGESFAQVTHGAGQAKHAVRCTTVEQSMLLQSLQDAVYDRSWELELCCDCVRSGGPNRIETLENSESSSNEQILL